MTPGVTMLAGGAILLLGLVLMLWNFSRAAKAAMDGGGLAFASLMRRMTGHLAFGLLAMAGFLLLVGGFVWKMVLLAAAR